jgi:hypothetical protein
VNLRKLSPSESAELLSAFRYGRLGLSLENHPYVIPMSYVYSNGKIYLHSRKKGEKVGIATNNPNACFEVDILSENLWSSVVARGKIKFSTDIATKRIMFNAYMFKDMRGHGGKPFKQQELNYMDFVIWEMEIEEITGREGIW